MKKIDYIILKIFENLKPIIKEKSVPILKFTSKIYDSIKELATKFTMKIFSPIKNKIPNFKIQLDLETSALLEDIKKLWINNKNIILQLFRLYIYACFILWIIAFSFITIAILMPNNFTIIIAKTIWVAYDIWTRPIKPVRFLIKKILVAPLLLIRIIKNIISCIVWVFKEILKDEGNHIKRSFQPQVSEAMENNNTSDKCKNMPSSAPQWETNCIDNKVQKISVVGKFISEVKEAGRMSSTQMDNSEKPDTKMFFNAYGNLQNGWNTVNQKTPCPNFHLYSECLRREEEKNN